MVFYRESEFQETTIGEMPRAWNAIELSAIGKVSTGKTPSTANKSFWNGEIPFITPADIDGTKYVYLTGRKVTSEGAKQSTILPKNSVLVVCIGSTIGKVALTNNESVTNQQINSIICNKDVVDPEFLYYSIFFRSASLKSFSGIAAVPIIKKSLFEHFKVPLPCLLEEQRAVVGVLGVVDSAVGLADRVIAKTERLKQGLMQQLLAHGIGHTEYKNTPTGKIPKNWEIAKVGDVLSLEYGKGLPERERAQGKYPVVGSNGVIGYHTQAFLEGPGIVVGRKGTIGAVTWIETDFWPIDTTYYVKPKIQGLNLKWLFNELRFLNPAKFRLADVVPGLKRELVYSMTMPLPPRPEQDKIVDALEIATERLQIEIEEKARLITIKQGLMDLLLTGKVRIKVD